MAFNALVFSIVLEPDNDLLNKDLFVFLHISLRVHILQGLGAFNLGLQL
jgi:hypothetical protein